LGPGAAAYTADRHAIANNALSVSSTNTFYNNQVLGIPQGNDNRTVSFWYKSNSNVSHSLFNYSTNNNTFGIAYDAGKILVSNYTTEVSYAITHNNNWNHVAVVHNNGTSTIYYNNVAVASGSITYSNNNNDIRIGTTPAVTSAYPNGFAAGDFAMDELMIYSSALTAQQVAILYNMGACDTVPVFSSPDKNYNVRTCKGGQVNLYSYATSSDALQFYSWYRDGNVLANQGSNNWLISQADTVDAGIYTVRMTTHNCLAGKLAAYNYNHIVDTIAPPAAGSTSTSSFTPCVGSTNSVAVGINNPERYDWTWTLPNGWTGSSNNNGITVVVADTSTSLLATASNGCGTRDFGFGSVTPIDTQLIVPDSIILHSGALCAGNQVYLRVDGINGYTYTWNFPTDWVQTPYPVLGIVIVTAPASGTVTVTASNSCSAGSATYSQYITVYPQPNKPVITQVGNTLQTTATAATYSWYDYYEQVPGDTTIQGPTGKTFVPKGNSTFQLYTITENGCFASSDTFQFTGATVGIQDPSNIPYTVYPNPANNVVHIKAAQSIDITITDLQGRIIYTAEKISGVHTISTRDMNNGIYLVYTGKGQQTNTGKIIIAR